MTIYVMKTDFSPLVTDYEVFITKVFTILTTPLVNLKPKCDFRFDGSKLMFTKSYRLREFTNQIKCQKFDLENEGRHQGGENREKPNHEFSLLLNNNIAKS